MTIDTMNAYAARLCTNYQMKGHQNQSYYYVGKVLSQIAPHAGEETAKIARLAACYFELNSKETSYLSMWKTALVTTKEISDANLRHQMQALIIKEYEGTFWELHEFIYGVEAEEPRRKDVAPCADVETRKIVTTSQVYEIARRAPKQFVSGLNTIEE